ncbi:type I-E CRISPR-associated protein Cas5/CasD [Suicoccus acidiformans]|nr:type I-E CRISPR-associated protein Cas5/CasD [Suicoccus acidiformans]
MKTILLKFAGPMQAWGSSSSFETRDTDTHPTKSAIIGLIGASLGYRRDDELIHKLNELKIAVRVDQPGRRLHDYHTAAKTKANGSFERTYVTNRYYLEDAVFIVAINHPTDAWITEIAEALKHPYFQGYLGRRSLPLTYDYFLGVIDKDIIQAIEEIPWQAHKSYQKKHSNKVTVFMDAELSNEGPVTMRKDRVKSFSQKNRMFDYRGEVRRSVFAPIKTQLSSTEHDAFDAI